MNVESRMKKFLDDIEHIANERGMEIFEKAELNTAPTTEIEREELEGLSHRGIALLRDMAVVEGEDGLYREDQGMGRENDNEIQERGAVWKRIRNAFAGLFG